MNVEQLLITAVVPLFSAVGGYIFLIEKRHRKERKEMREDHQKEREQLMEINQVMFNKLGEIAKDGQRTAEEGYKVLREHSNLLAAFKSLFENQRRGR